MSVVVFHGIPEEFLFLADTVDGFDQAAREQVGKFPYYGVDFFVQKFEICIGFFSYFTQGASIPQWGFLCRL